MSVGQCNIIQCTLLSIKVLKLEKNIGVQYKNLKASFQVENYLIQTRRSYILLPILPLYLKESLLSFDL